ncbi:MAG TPA: RIP metalloprotease RseP [Geminicoccaceae bacterium]|nr:RIP metalloprotease RseP [Geminicoccaceae bacterium]
MEFLGTTTQYVVPFLLILSVVVFVHEFGHYWVARRNGVRVETFSIGFGPELFGRNDRHGTRWKFSVIPLGGYVKMLGDADATSTTVDVRHVRDPESFPAKSVWQRMAIVFAGPAANFLFAIVVLAALFVFSGRPFTPPEVGAVQEDSPAAAAGLAPGDRVVAIDGDAIESFEQLQAIVRQSPDRPLALTIERAGQTVEVVLTPALSEITDRFGNTHRVGLIGISRAGVEFRQVDPLSAVLEAATETWRMVVGTLAALGEMIVGSRGTAELGGPLRIAQMSGQIAADGIVPVLWFSAVLSINLGLINLFPIPMLDGGHLVMYAIEAARGRPLTERAQEIAFRFGLAMVLTLMVFATWNDLVHLRIVEFFSSLVS